MMHLLDLITVLAVLCTLCSLCACTENVAYHKKHHIVSKTTGLQKQFSRDIGSEAQCTTLLKHIKAEYLHKRDWTEIQKQINPYYLHTCYKYVVALYFQFHQRKIQHSRTLFRRDANSGRRDIESKKLESKQNTTKDEDAEHIGNGDTRVYTKMIHKFATTNTVASEEVKNQSGGTVVRDGDDDTVLPPWVFILIGLAALVVLAVPSAAAFIHYRKKRAQQHLAADTIPTIADTSSLMYDTQRSASTDKGTERSKSTISTYLSKDSREVTESYELMPLRAAHDRERSSVTDMFDDIDRSQNERSARCIEYNMQSPSSTKITNLSESSHARSCSDPKEGMRAYGRQHNRELPRLHCSQEIDGNKLRGGNTDFQRRNVEFIRNNTDLVKRSRNQNASVWEQETRERPSSHAVSPPSSPSQGEDCELHMYRQAGERNRNESKSSSSTRSYISIPPTSPSEKYVEAGSDGYCMSLERSMPLVKTTWLTKILEGDTRNEFRNYHAHRETQTDNGSSVKAPNCKTVFGTPWQFGGTFTNRGGVMQANDSDVSLVVVPGAVPKGEYVDIYGAVFTDTTAIRKRLKFSAKECLITPVVEYCAVPASPFRRPVCVQLPHALPEEFDINLIRVYTFSVGESGKVSLFKVPVSSKANEDRDLGTYWEKSSDGHSIHINTFHFSGYFCTQCETSSWPSICTMVFGSHVQITQSRREVRVILYIWDRRLTIKDYLERFRKQESDVDRQLLTDMQVPLLDSASSDSRLVMCMEVMGGEDDRQCWRHVLRPDGSRPLFKPLQMRKLSEIVDCCRQTDPIRVEWALENAPHQVPNAVFQCCIDIMHVHESTSDYESAMREGSDDLMRTFYVRDLKVVTNSSQESKQSADFQRVDLKRTLSETMDIAQTERMCQEFGMSIKDIGNFRRKYSTLEAFQMSLVEECLRRHGSDKFLSLLPKILERLQYTEVISALDDKKILVRSLTDFTTETSEHSRIEEVTTTSTVSSLGGGRDTTRHKSPYRRSSSPEERNRSNSPNSRRRRSRDRDSQKPAAEHRSSEKNDYANNYSNSQHMSPTKEEQHCKARDWDDRQLKRRSKHREQSPPADYEEDERAYSQNIKSGIKKYNKNIEERQPLNKQKSSSSTGDSVLGSISHSSDYNSSSRFSSRSTPGTSMFAHADPNDFLEPLSDQLQTDSMKQTYKKEFQVNQNVHGHLASNEHAAYFDDNQYMSSIGPSAIPAESGHADVSHLSDPVPPYRGSGSGNRSYEKSQLPDKDQTLKKELYGISTVV